MKKRALCPVHPAKASYASAVRATYQAGIKGKRHGHKLYPYRCDACARWHLTSKNDDPTKQKRTA